MRIVIAILLCFVIKTSLAQQYNGVNVTRIRGKQYQGTVEKPSFHRFAIGVNLPRSMNFEGDGSWYRSEPAEQYYKMEIPGIQAEYAYHWNRYAFVVRAMYEQAIREAKNAPKGQSGGDLHMNQFTYSFGGLYKWMYREQLQLYSGFTIGSAVQSVNMNTGLAIKQKSRQGFGSIQVIALGINYKFSNFGIFGELGYGTKGLANLGAFYNI